MKNVAKKIFAGIAGTALALTPAGTAFANDDAPMTNSVAAVTPNASTVQYVDATGESIAGARGFAAAASNDKVAIIVWGGNRTLQQEAYNAARDLAGAGIPTAFVLAPDHNNSDAEAVMQVYAASIPRTDAVFGTNYANLVRSSMREAGVNAYRDAFPQQVAALSLR